MFDPKVLDQLAPGHGRPDRALDREEGKAILRALRRGVPQAAIAKVMSGSRRQNLGQILGTWAIHYCTCCEEKESK